MTDLLHALRTRLWRIRNHPAADNAEVVDAVDECLRLVEEVASCEQSASDSRGRG